MYSNYSFMYAMNAIILLYCVYCSLQALGVRVVKAAAGVGKSVFISSKGEGYWCGEWTGTLEHVRAVY